MADNNNNSGALPNQASSGTPQPGAGSDASLPQQTPKFLEGIDLSELPEDVRTKLQEKEKTFNETNLERTKFETQAKQAEEFGRSQQSRADRATTVLQRHNLSLDGNSQGNQPSQEDLLVQQFIKDGLKEDVAKGYAKMFTQAGNLQQQQILQNLAPFAQTVAGIQATQILQQAQLSHKAVFDVPEVAKQINDNVQILLSEGKPVDAPTMQHLVSMAWGAHLLKNPQQQPNMNGQVPTFGGGVATGGVVNQPNGLQQQQNGQPRATQPETVRITDLINVEMRRGLKTKK